MEVSGGLARIENINRTSMPMAVSIVVVCSIACDSRPPLLVTGSVVDSNTGAAIEVFEVGLKRGQRSGNDLWETEYRTGESISILPGPPHDLRQIRDPSGRFQLDLPDTDREVFTVFVRLPTGKVQYRKVDIGDGDDPEDIEIRIAMGEEDGRVIGSVVDEAGQPVQDAVVSLGPIHFHNGGEEENGGTDNELTDANGSFQIFPNKITLICASHPDYGLGYADLTSIPEADKGIVIRLSAVTGLQGTINDAGHPVPNQLVSVSSRTDSGKPFFSTYAYSDADGQFQIEAVPIVGSMISSETMEMDPLYSRKIRYPLELIDENWDAVRISFAKATAKVVGNATIERSNSRIAAFDLRSLSGDTSEEVKAVVKFSPDGDFETPLIPSGEVILRCVAINPDGSKDVRVLELTLQDGKILHQDFVVPEGNEIVAGRVGDYPEETKGAVFALAGHVRIHEYDMESMVIINMLTCGDSVVDDTGSFTIQNLSAGPYTLVLFYQPFGAKDPFDRTILRTKEVSLPNDGGLRVEM